jgi:hypothetical protein
MADSVEYLIPWSDTNLKSTPIVVEPNTETQAGTSINFVGHGKFDYGQPVLENFVKLLENFASRGTAPANPTIGQTWYDADTTTTKVWDGTYWKNPSIALTSNAPAVPHSADLWFDPVATIIKYWNGTAWVPFGTFSSANPPTNPQEGMLWYDINAKMIKYWNGTSWVPMGAFSSDTAPTSPYLGMMWFDISNSMLKYWDGTAWQTIGNSTVYVHKNGDTMNGQFTLQGADSRFTVQYTPTNDGDLVPLVFLNTAINNIAGNYASINPGTMANAAVTKDGDIHVVNGIVSIYNALGGGWCQVYPPVYQ